MQLLKKLDKREIESIFNFLNFRESNIEPLLLYKIEKETIEDILSLNEYKEEFIRNYIYNENKRELYDFIYKIINLSEEEIHKSEDLLDKVLYGEDFNYKNIYKNLGDMFYVTPNYAIEYYIIGKNKKIKIYQTKSKNFLEIITTLITEVFYEEKDIVIPEIYVKKLETFQYFVIYYSYYPYTKEFLDIYQIHPGLYDIRIINTSYPVTIINNNSLKIFKGYFKKYATINYSSKGLTRGLYIDEYKSKNNEEIKGLKINEITKIEELIDRDKPIRLIFYYNNGKFYIYDGFVENINVKGRYSKDYLVVSKESKSISKIIGDDTKIKGFIDYDENIQIANRIPFLTSALLKKMYEEGKIIIFTNKINDILREDYREEKESREKEIKEKIIIWPTIEKIYLVEEANLKKYINFVDGLAKIKDNKVTIGEEEYKIVEKLDDLFYGKVCIKTSLDRDKLEYIISFLEFLKEKGKKDIDVILYVDNIDNFLKNNIFKKFRFKGIVTKLENIEVLTYNLFRDEIRKIFSNINNS